MSLLITSKDVKNTGKIRVLAPSNRIDESVDLNLFDAFELNLKPKYNYNKEFLDKFCENPLSFGPDDFQLPIYSIHPPYSEKDIECFNLAVIDQNQTKELKKIIEFGANAGVKVIIAHAGHVYSLKDMEKGEKNFISNMKELAPFANDRGVRVGIENEAHNRNDFYRLGQSYKKVEYMIKEIDCPSVGAVLDIAHLLCLSDYNALDDNHYSSNYEYAEIAVEKLSPYSVLAHISYNHGNFDEHLPLTKIEEKDRTQFQKIIQKTAKCTPALLLEISEDFEESVYILNRFISS